MSFDARIDELTDEIRRKADSLDTADYGEFPERCGELHRLLDEVERLVQHGGEQQ